MSRSLIKIDVLSINSHWRVIDDDRRSTGPALERLINGENIFLHY